MEAKKADRMETVLEAIRQERARQDEKWGADRQQAHTFWHTILSEEVGEAAEAALNVDICDRAAETYMARDWRRRLAVELIQTAAVAVAELEALITELGYTDELPGELQEAFLAVRHG